MTVKEFISQNPEVTIDMMTPGGYVYLTPINIQDLLNGESVIGHLGYSGSELKIDAEELLNQEILTSNYSDGLYYFLTDINKETLFDEESEHSLLEM